MNKKKGTVRITILDDNETYCLFLNSRLTHHLNGNSLLPPMKFEITPFTSPVDFLNNLRPDTDIAIIDYLINNEYNGIRVLEKLKEKCADCKVIIISSHTTINSSLLTILKGADLFIAKDKVGIINICYAVENFIENRQPK